MRLIRNYFLKEWLFSFFVSLGIFTLAFSLGNMVKLVDLIINKGVDPISIIQLFFMMVPFSLVYTVPISTLMSTLLVFGKASADNEIITLKASGVSAKKISKPFIILGLALTLISVIFMDKILPYTHYRAREMVFNIGRKNPTAYLEPGTFIKSFKNHIIFFYGMKRNELKNVRIYVSEESRPLRTIIAQRAVINEITDKGLTLSLYNGTSDEIDHKNPGGFYKLNFKEYIMHLNISRETESVKIDKKPSEYTVSELKQNIVSIRNKGMDALPIESELYKRYAQPFSCLAFILIGLPLGIKTHRREKSVGFGIGLLIIVFYYIAFVTSETLVLNKTVPVAMGHWIPTVLIFLAGLYLYNKLDEVGN
ncbi:MAG: LptF/LptG family permease [Candidatus Omnitrophica bacterium]|nr:LptF/LptG family permease [Candidatus Omnitrophota bacterium]